MIDYIVLFNINLENEYNTKFEYMNFIVLVGKSATIVIQVEKPFHFYSMDSYRKLALFIYIWRSLYLLSYIYYMYGAFRFRCCPIVSRFRRYVQSKATTPKSLIIDVQTTEMGTFVCKNHIRRSSFLFVLYFNTFLCGVASSYNDEFIQNIRKIRLFPLLNRRIFS